MTATKVSIQGYEGCFHQLAAQQYFGKSVTVIPCATFKQVVTIASDANESDGGVMAIENSIAGSILPNYTLLKNSQLQIVGEVYLPIEQHLLVNPGVRFEDIREVHSHHMAIEQCMQFLDKYDWKLVETEDTALSAMQVHKRRSTHTAAIAGALAADLFQLEILAENIHTQKNNYTRFLILQRKEVAQVPSDANKASINFVTNHTKGSLSKVLTTIADAQINLSKLQSMPIAGTNFTYSFHADLEFDHIQQFYTALDSMGSLTQQIQVFGIYKNGNNH
jgi:prephenate dehydratase